MKKIMTTDLSLQKVDEILFPPLPNVHLPVSVNRLRGIFTGTAIGDALGLPVETMTAQQINEKYGSIRSYVAPDESHKWYAGVAPGTISDDTQLTLSLAEALSSSSKFSPDRIAEGLMTALEETTLGWGEGTRCAVLRLKDGCHWSESGRSSDPSRGSGNGVPMRIAPLAAYTLCRGYSEEDVFNATKIISDMTHGTDVSAAAAFAHVKAVSYCLSIEPSDFSRKDFLDEVLGAVFAFESTREDGSPLSILKERMLKLFNIDSMGPNDIFEEFGGGTAFVPSSLPHTYAYFLKRPRSIESLYDVINSGGDTDSNGAMLGSLLGALNGEGIFPPEFIYGLVERDRIYRTANAFIESLV